MGLNAGSGVVKALSAGALAPILIGTLVVGFVPAHRRVGRGRVRCSR